MSGHHRGVDERHLIAITIKAWNAYREGRRHDNNPVRLLRWNPGGANPEPFPEPK